MQGLYISSFRNLSELSKKNSNGVLKKVFDQVRVLDSEVAPTEMINFLYKGTSVITRFLSCIFGRKSFLPAGKIPENLMTESNYLNIDFKKISYVYIRFFFPSRLGFLTLLKTMKKENPKIKILLEIPTYPYDKEQKSLKTKFLLMFDKKYRKKLKKYVDRIVTPGKFDEIFGCPVLCITNGTDVDSIPVVEAKEVDKTHIHVIAVAQFAFWHGYERFIEGMGEYYKTYGDKIGTEEYPNVTLHLVGDGDELLKYKGSMDKYSLQECVVFHGPQSGDELTKIFNICSVTLCSLGSHRKEIYITSELKSREYLSRGLPMVSAAKIDIINDENPYCHYVNADESSINIIDFVSWWRMCYSGKTRKKVISDIRTFAEENCTMETAMQSVIDYLATENSYSK